VTTTTTPPTPPPTPTPTTEPRIDPRIRERRIAVTRAAGRKRLRVLALIAGVIVITGSAYLAVTSPLLDVDRVQVVGVDPAAALQVRTRADVPRHAAMLFLDTSAIAHRVASLPWVAHVSVHRIYPGTVRITVVVRGATAFVRAGKAGVMLVASDGRVFARAASAPAGAIEIRGVRAAPNVGDELAPADAAAVASHLPRALASRVRAVDVSGNGIALVLATGGTVRLGDATELDEKAAATLAVLARIGAEPFAFLDVSTPQMPVLHR
jgi:cell division protein FtsQ